MVFYLDMVMAMVTAMIMVMVMVVVMVMAMLMVTVMAMVMATIMVMVTVMAIVMAMQALNEMFEIGLPLSSLPELQRVAREYSKFSNGHIKDVVTAIDGWVCRTRCPTSEEVMFPAHYRNRKGFFGIVVIAGCESNLRFNIFSSKCSGATHDSLAWEVSSAKHLIVDEGSHFPSSRSATKPSRRASRFIIIFITLCAMFYLLCFN